MMPAIGNTVKLKAEFRDYDGDLVDISNPRIKVYDANRGLIEEGVPERTTTGIYVYDFVVPNYVAASRRDEPLVFEFSGTLGDQAVVGRSSIERVWCDD